MKSGSQGFSLATLLSWLAPVAVMVALWYPHVAQYYLSTPHVTPEAVQFPLPDEMLELRRRHYDWYNAHASSRQTAGIYAKALR